MSGKTQGRRAAIYSRKSTDDGGDGRSIDAQLHDCHALAKAHGYEVVETYNEGTGVSPIRACREMLGLGIAVPKFGGSFFGNGALPGAVIEVGGQLSEAGVVVQKASDGYEELSFTIF